MSEESAANAMNWDEATSALLSVGSPFEMTTETILGEKMAVFSKRAPSLRALLAQSANHGDSEYYVFDTGERCSFIENVDRVAALASALADKGIVKGDRIAILSANNPQWLTIYWAVVSLGGVVVAMNGWWSAEEVSRGLRAADPSLLFLDRRRLERIDEVDTGVPTLLIEDTVEEMIHANAGETLPEVELSEDDPAVLLFTSGTTGQPKGALLSHRNVIGFVMTAFFLGARMSMINPGQRATPGVYLAAFPLFHVAGLFTSATTQLAAGSKTVWTTGRFDAGKVIELSRQEKITNWSGAATHIWRLLDHPAFEGFDGTQLSGVAIGGSATTPELIRATEERLPHLMGTFASGYGSTETGSLISHASNAMLMADSASVGPPLPGVEVRIVDDSGEAVEDGIDGNILVRSALVMLGYWDNDEANADTLLPGRWLKTGDFGQLRDGQLRLASRKRDLIIRGGENIYPAEVENRLEQHPDVAEVAVFGVDHRELGQEVKAVVVPLERSSPSEADLKAWVAEALAYFKVPAHVEVRDEPMPRNATGKILKNVLRGDSENLFVEE
ncbi:MAG: class I adenylate-forming enzyme family protein [Acidimicrobiales bacterium]